MPARPYRLLILLGLAALAAAGLPARAEKADRFKPLKTESDLPGRIDLLNQVVVLNGNVGVTKGTIVIRAARIEVRESPDGYQTAIAYGSPAQHATFRQKRDEPNEWIEGDAERLEYDGKADKMQMFTRAMMKRTELTFLVSVRVPSGSPGLRTETLTSARIEPCSILPSHEPT